MKKTVSIVLAALLICSVLSACGISSNSPTPSKVGNLTAEDSSGAKQNSKAETTKAPETTQAPLKDIYQVGDVIQLKDHKIVYTASGEYVSSNVFSQPGDGNKYIYLEFYVENTGSSSVTVSYFDFDAYADGYAADQKYSFDDALSGSISPGRWNMGRVYFEVPENASDIEVEYEYEMFSSKKLKFAYEGEKDSGFVPEAKTTPTEGSFKPGDIIETSKFRITYLGCDTFESDNRFIQPDEGNIFIYLEFEFENISDSDRSVNSLYFSCYADGKICSSTSMRDDDLHASLSPGRKAKGTVAFQVPADASVVEVEFEDTLILSNSVVIFSFEK